MRIVGGRWRTRRIEWPDAGTTRPITDRVREAVFDILGVRYGTPGALPGIHVADVFSGGGSLGLEALSRGAGTACFFDRDRDAVRVLRRNLENLEAGSAALVVVGDVYRSGLRAPDACVPFELIFVDPPFPDARNTSPSSHMHTFLRRLGSSRHVSADALVVLRHEQNVAYPVIIGKHWRQDDQRDYGRSRMTFLVRVEATDAESDEEGSFPTED